MHNIRSSHANRSVWKIYDFILSKIKKVIINKIVFLYEDI